MSIDAWLADASARCGKIRALPYGMRRDNALDVTVDDLLRALRLVVRLREALQSMPSCPDGPDLQAAAHIEAALAYDGRE